MKSRASWGLITGGVALAAIAWAMPGAGAGMAAIGQQETYELSGDRVSIYNIAGEVEVVRGSGRDVVVEVMRGGDDADRLSVEIDRMQGRNMLRVIYPDDQVVYSEGRGRFRTEMRVRDDGTFGGGWGDRGRRTRVRSDGSGLEAHANLRISIPAGRNVHVYQAVGNVDVRDVDADLLLDTHAGGVTVDEVDGDVEVDTGSGGVRVTGVRGNVGVDTGSGHVEVRDIEGDEVIVDTGSGHVEGTGIIARDLEVDTGSGHVELGAVEATNILVDTGSGGVELEVLRDIDTLTVDTGSGSVTLHLPAELGAEIEADTGSGGIDIDIPVDVERMRRDYFRGTAGDGRGSIEIDTGSGRIRLIQR